MKIVDKIKRLFVVVRNKYQAFRQKRASKRPSPLPIGVPEFHSWADDVISLAGLPNNDSLKFTLASCITHALPPNDPKYVPYSKHMFAGFLRKLASNQVAMGVMADLKEKQQAKVEAEKKALEANVVSSTVLSN